MFFIVIVVFLPQTSATHCLLY